MRRTLAVLSLLFASLALSSPSLAGTKAKNAPEISLEELKTLMSTKAKVVYVDANGSTMYEEGHAPNAVHFASAETNLKTTMEKVATKSDLIIAYCGGPKCTAWEEAAAALEKLGYTNIKHFKGGISGMKEAGFPLDKGKFKMT